MSDLVGAALDYAARGWPVFPVKPRQKRPLGSLVQNGLHDASTDPEVIRSWWIQAPDANLGLRTGVAFDVVDVDGPDGLVALIDARPSDDDGLDRGPQTWTGGGGWHLFQAVTGKGNRARLVPKVDFRGQGGYIVAPPSVHPSGELYRWDPDFGPGLPLGGVPGWIMALIDPPVAAWAAPAVRPPGHEKVTAYGQRALEAETGKLLLAAVGQRNDQLNRSAFALGQLVAGGVLSEAEVTAALLEAAQRVGLGQKESQASVTSGLRSGARTPRSVPA